MPLIEVEGPQGIIEISVPDGVDVDQAISSVMSEAAPPKQAALPIAPSAPRTPDSAMTRFARGAAQSSVVPAAQLMSRPLAMLGKATGSEFLQSLPGETDSLAS